MTEKLKSRTFWFALIWTGMVPIAFILQGFISFELPLGALVTIAGTVTLGYLGKRAVQESKRSGE